MQAPAGIDRDRLSVLTGALVLSLALARFLDVPVRSTTLVILGSEVGMELSATTVMMLISVGLAVTGVESLIRIHPRAGQRPIGHSTMHWILPGLLIVALASWLAPMNDVGQWTIAVLASSIPIPVALAAEYLAADSRRPPSPLLQWAHQAVLFLAAFLLFTRIYDARARSLISGSATVIVGALLATRLYWGVVRNTWDTVLYGLITGLLLGQLIWALNYWRLSSLEGGYVLWLFYYVVTGLLRQSLVGLINLRIVFEYVGLAILASLLAFAVVSI